MSKIARKKKRVLFFETGHQHTLFDVHLWLIAFVAVSIGVMMGYMGYTVLAGTRVPGHNKVKYDQDDNGYPDAGVYVNGHYTALYAYDNNDWYWDLGDGRIQGTVGSVDDLDQATLTKCDYVNNYRADFGNDPYMNKGWIQNHINCSGYDDNSQYNYLIVHKTDPRYTGNPEWKIWGDWEYKALTISGFGNLVRPENAVGAK